MTVQERLRGMIVPLITPLTEEEKLDEDGLRRCIGHVLRGGVNGVFILGTTGESACLTDDVRERLMEAAAEEVKGKALFIAGISDTGTKRVLKNLKKAEAVGADAVVAHPPFFLGLADQEELLTFYRTIAEATDLPLILYNIPGITKQPLALKTVETLAGMPSIIGIKDSSVNYLFMLDLIKLKKEHSDFRVFVGKTHMFVPCLLAGGDGGVDGITNLIPERCVRLLGLMEAGRVSEAWRLQEEINEIWNVHEVRSFLSGIKTAMHLAGLCGPTVTSPVVRASEKEVAHVRAIMKRYGLLQSRV